MSSLADSDADNLLRPLQAASCTYRIALGPRAGQKVLSLQTIPRRGEPSTPALCANAHGFSLHAAVRCGADQRKELERLCRYITRPAIANERLKRNDAGDVVLQLKSAYQDGTTHIVMSPLEFMQRLGRAGAASQAASDSLPRRARAPRQAACRDRSEPSGESHRAFGRSRACTLLAGAHELGAPAQAGVRHRSRTLPELWRRLKDHRRH